MGEEAGIAAKMAQGIATGVLAGQAANLTDPIFASLGIAQGSDTDAKYFQQVMDELKKIEGDLNQIAAKMQVISSGISEIENALTAISSQITDSELESQLAQYTENANIIDTNYQAYAAALAAMAKGDTNSIQEGTNQLFNLFGTNNSDAVASAMKNIHDLLVGVGELHGIISYQTEEVLQAYPAFSAQVPDSSYLVSGLPTVLVGAFQQTIIPTLKSALAVQLKGLNFLCAAWAGTINEPRLADVTAGVGKVIEEIQGLYALFDFDALVAKALQANGHPYPRPGQGLFLENRSDECSDPLLSFSGNPLDNPFDTSWLWWSQIKADDPNLGPMTYMVKEPWLFGSVPSYFVEIDVNMMCEFPDGHFAVVQNYALCTSLITIVRPSSTVIAPPQNFISFLASMPPTAAPDPSINVNEGTRVQDSSDRGVYLMLDGAARWIPNSTTYENLYGNNWAGIIQITTIKAYPRTLPLTDGAYIARGTPDSKVFLILDGTKRWITGQDVFNHYGFDWSQIRTLPPDQLSAIPDGANIQ